MAARGPWFRERPAATVAVAAVLFVAVFVLRLAVEGVADVVTMLYTLPVALLAVAFGARAGVLSGVVAVGLVAGWAIAADAEISALGWVARIVPLLLLGYLLGDAADRVRQVDAERRVLERAAQRHRDAVEINDTIVQGMAAAKWSLEAGDVDSGVRTLAETMVLARGLVSELLRGADMGPTGPRTADRRFSRASASAHGRQR